MYSKANKETVSQEYSFSTNYLYGFSYKNNVQIYTTKTHVHMASVVSPAGVAASATPEVAIMGRPVVVLARG